jgi:ABC-2 type transport system ATP-binding protein
VLGAPLGDRRARGRIGFLPEHFRFHEWLTGRELLRFHGRLFGLHGARLDARIETLLDRVDLLDSSERALREYSKGMLQRVGLAQAMLNEPELVFLDEPTSGLDPLGRVLVRDVIGELRARGTTVFLNSHLLGEVEVTCDRVAFVKRGHIAREVTLADQPDELEVELRIGPAASDLSAQLARFGRELPGRNGTLRLRVKDEETLPEIARWLVERGVRLYSMRASRKSLETLFLEVMGDEARPG